MNSRFVIDKQLRKEINDGMREKLFRRINPLHEYYDSDIDILMLLGDIYEELIKQKPTTLITRGVKADEVTYWCYFLLIYLLDLYKVTENVADEHFISSLLNGVYQDNYYLNIPELASRLRTEDKTSRVTKQDLRKMRNEIMIKYFKIQNNFIQLVQDGYKYLEAEIVPKNKYHVSVYNTLLGLMVLSTYICGVTEYAYAYKLIKDDNIKELLDTSSSLVKIQRKLDVVLRASLASIVAQIEEKAEITVCDKLYYNLELFLQKPEILTIIGDNVRYKHITSYSGDFVFMQEYTTIHGYQYEFKHYPDSKELENISIMVVDKRS